LICAGCGKNIPNYPLESEGKCRLCLLKRYQKKTVNNMLLPSRQLNYETAHCYRSEIKAIKERIPQKNISLFKKEGKLWSVTRDAEGRSVEAATAEYLISKGFNLCSENVLLSIARSAILATSPSDSRIWKEILREVRLPFTHRMYDEGRTLEIVWRQQEPRISDKDRQVIREAIPSLHGKFTVRDTLSTLLTHDDKEPIQSKEQLINLGFQRIKNLKLPHSQTALLEQSLVVFTKHKRLPQIKRHDFLGSVTNSYDIDEVINLARNVSRSQVEDVVQKVLDWENQQYLDHRLKNLWRAFQSHKETRAIKFKGIMQNKEFLDFIDRSPFDLDEIYQNQLHTPQALQNIRGVLNLIQSYEVIDYFLYSAWRFTRNTSVSGQSDLFAWTTNALYFYEVKSPNDRLRDNQFDLYYSVMEPLGLNYELINITPSE